MLGWSKDPADRPMGRTRGRLAGDDGPPDPAASRRALFASLVAFPLFTAAVMGVLALGFWVTSDRGLPPPTTIPAGAFSFATLGDGPYYPWENGPYRAVLRDIGAHPLSGVVHVGDILDNACTRERYERTRDEFNGLPHPVIYTPGDNEWTDCRNGFTPLNRLALLRETLFADPARSLGSSSIDLEHQGKEEGFAEFVENARWIQHDVVFTTVHLVGSRNAMDPFAGRTEADDEASRRRTEAAATWLRGAFTVAEATGSPAVVVALHANILFEEPVDDPYRVAFEPFTQALEEEVARFGRPVLLIHGDWHEYTIDRPLRHRADGRPIENLTRLQVPGSPDIGWVRVTIDLGADDPFTFERRVVPFWR